MNFSTEADSGTRPARPMALCVMHKNIPPELRNLCQWVVWQYEFIKGKWTKPPYQVDGKNAKTDDPSTWTFFEAVLKRYERGGVDGIGIVLTSEIGIVGIDLDHCFDSTTRKAEKWAIDIIQKMNSYSEFSPSGTGVRIFVKGKLPNGVKGRKKGNIELYVAGRYLTITGNRL